MRARAATGLSRIPTAIRFLLAGGFAALINFGSRIVLSFWMPNAAADVLAYCVGMATAFALNRQFVFLHPTNRLREQVVWFVVINLVALLQTLAVSELLLRVVLPMCGIVWHAEELAHAAGITVPIVTSYLGHKRWTFR
jgi:putative flippase GtrA